MPVFDPVVFTNADNIFIAPTARIDSFVKVEGGRGVTIGEHVHIASFAHINIGGGEVVIEDGASMASGAKIVAGSASLEGETCSAAAPMEQQIIERSKVVLKKNATLFTNSVVLPGVTVGEGAALAAGSVATKDIPAGELWGGVPARFMRMCK